MRAKINRIKSQVHCNRVRSRDISYRKHRLNAKSLNPNKTKTTQIKTKINIKLTLTITKIINHKYPSKVTRKDPKTTKNTIKNKLNQNKQNQNIKSQTNLTY